MALTGDHGHISSDGTPHTARRIHGHEYRREACLLGLTAPDALAWIAGPPCRAGQDKSALPAAPEAAK